MTPIGERRRCRSSLASQSRITAGKKYARRTKKEREGPSRFACRAVYSGGDLLRTAQRDGMQNSYHNSRTCRFSLGLLFRFSSAPSPSPPSSSILICVLFFFRKFLNIQSGSPSDDPDASGRRFFSRFPCCVRSRTAGGCVFSFLSGRLLLA